MSFQRYFSEQSQPPIILKGVSHTQNETEHKHFLHMHNFLELIFVVDGKGKMFASNHSFPLKKNDVVVINPLLKHTEISDLDNPLDYYVISLQNISLTQTQNEAEPIFLLKNTFANLTTAFFESLTSTADDISTKLQAYNFVYQILGRLISENKLLVQTSNLPNLPTTPPTNASGIVKFLSNYIDQHYTEEINLDTISRLLNVSKSYLIRIFKKDLGKTPIAYLIDKRITNAKYLLENHSYPITQICFDLGFASSAYFSKIFKQHTGMTPTQYRQKKKSEPPHYLYDR